MPHKMKRISMQRDVLTLLFFCALTISIRVSAGGFKIPDQSTRAMGMIDAFIGGADDASAIYYNPAGLTHLTRPEFIGNMYFAHGITYYDGVSGSESSDGRYYVIPNFYLAAPVKGFDDWFVGLGVYSPYGLGSKWADDGVLRYETTLSEIQLVNLNPTIAWRATDRLSLGGGANYFMSRVKMRNMAMNPPGESDAHQSIDADGDGWGYNLGLQYKLTKTVNLGLTYRSRVTVNYSGDYALEGIAAPAPFPPGYMITNLYGDMEGEIKFPASVAGGVKWQATPQLRLELAAEWQQWSVRDTQDFTVSGTGSPMLDGTASRPTDWKDSWLIMIGGEYELNDKWALRTGYGYNQTPVPRETAEPSLPAGDTHAISLGAGYQVSENLSLDMAGIMAYGEKRTIRDPSGTGGGTDYTGDYEAWSFYVSLGVRYKF